MRNQSAPAQRRLDWPIKRLFQSVAAFLVVPVHQRTPFTQRIGLSRASKAFGICRKKSLME
jgi:hypothetical protein